MNRRSFMIVASTSGVGLLATGSTALVTGCSTNWITVVTNDIPELINIANSVISIVGLATGNGSLAAGLGTEVTLAANALKVTLSSLQDAANAYNANKSQGNLSALIAAIQAVQNDLSKVVAALPPGSISSTVETSLVALIGLAVTIISSIQALVPGAAPVAVTARAAQAAVTGKVAPPSAETMRFAVNATLRMHGFGQLAN